MSLDVTIFNPIFNTEENSDEESSVATIIRGEVQRPKLYKVLLHNDDYTTMEFVIFILKKYFAKTEPQAHDIMLKVHNEGVGLCGIYTYEVAETKVAKVSREAKEKGHPLRCSFESE